MLSSTYSVTNKISIARVLSQQLSVETARELSVLEMEDLTREKNYFSNPNHA